METNGAAVSAAEAPPPRPGGSDGASVPGATMPAVGVRGDARHVRRGDVSGVVDEYASSLKPLSDPAPPFSHDHPPI